LGAGESVKSTIAKQMKIIHMGGFTKDERESYITAIHQNVWEAVGVIFQASATLEVNIKKKDNRHFAQNFLAQPFPGKITPDLADGILAFWEDAGVQKLYERRNEYQLIDSAGYYIQDIRRVTDPSYVPTEQDVLRSRIQTTGIIETSFVIEGKKFFLVDVGGQRSERKKWMHCFEDVTGVLFCVGISEFDKTLYEDNKTNRIHEARKLFHEICQSKWFTQTAMILFLNKDDLFRDKIISGKSIKICFDDFPGPDTYDASVQFMEAKFKDVFDPATGKPKEIYTHVTCATDTTSVRAVFEAVKDFILSSALASAGLL